jgi:hypothetical protein
MSLSSNYGLIEPESDDKVIWRYLSYPKLLNLLNSEELRFTRADRFTDPLEGYLPRKTMLRWLEKAQQKNHDRAKAWNWGDDIDLVEGLMDKNPVEVIQHQRKLGFVSCWNADHREKEELWKDYTPGGKGVVIKSTVGRLKEAIQNIKLENLSIGEVRYLDFEDGGSPIIRKFAQYPLSYKHTKYEDEREIRAIVFQTGFSIEEFDQLEYQDMANNEEEYLDSRRSTSASRFIDGCEYQSEPVTTGVDVEKLIEGIRISPLGSDWQQRSLDRIVSNKLDLDITVERSALDLDTEPDKPSVDIEPEELYSDIKGEEFITLDDLDNLNYDLD